MIFRSQLRKPDIAGISRKLSTFECTIKHGITVAEVTYSNNISVSEEVVIMILSLMRNHLPSYEWIRKGGSNIADCVERSYDLEGVHVGTTAPGLIGRRGAEIIWDAGLRHPG